MISDAAVVTLSAMQALLAAARPSGASTSPRIAEAVSSRRQALVP
jgi:hypothetical protein